MGVAAACEGRKAGEEEGLPPLWLRLDYNETETPQELVDDWKSRELTITTYPNAPSRHNLSKGVHLPFFLSQGKPAGYVHGESERKRDYHTSEKEEEGYEKPQKEKTHKATGQLKWKVKVVKEEGGGEEGAEGETEDTAGAERIETAKKEKKDKRSRQRQVGEDDDDEQERDAFDEDAAES